MAESRIYKGTSLVEFPDSYAVIDLETTGLDPRWCEIIELAAIRIVNGAETERFESLTKPSCPVPDFITQITGITNEMLGTAPALSDVLPQFLDFIGSDILVGHNVHFDLNFLYDNALELGLPPVSNNFVDTLRVSRYLYKDLPNHKLSTIKQHLNVGSANAHRAIVDCLDTNECFSKMALQEKELVEILHQAKLRRNWKPSDIIAQTECPDEDNPLFNKDVVFTGKLARYERKEAMQLVANCGGRNQSGVNRETDLLVVGDLEYSSSVKDGISNKIKAAQRLILKGFDIAIVSESVFYDMLE